MQDLIASGANWFDQQRRQHMAVLVAYQAVAALFPANIPASIGLTRWETIDQAGTMLRYETRDYFISTTDLPAAPAKGDTITETADGVTRTYQVAGPPGGGNAWSWADRGQKIRRIHTQLIGTV